MNAVSDILADTVVPDIFGVAEDPKPNPPPTRRRPPRILLAEDDLEMRRCLAEALRKASYKVVEAVDGDRAVNFITTCLIATDGIGIDLVISDVRMPGIDGLHLLSVLRTQVPGLPVILITAFGNPELHKEARLRGAVAVIDKPFAFETLIGLVRHVLRTCDAPCLRSENRGFNPLNS